MVQRGSGVVDDRRRRRDENEATEDRQPNLFSEKWIKEPPPLGASSYRAPLDKDTDRMSAVSMDKHGDDSAILPKIHHKFMNRILKERR
ncbi:hypothetical protein EVAR_20153_1 [Eumeta japonica]|uniref:Uncharacterized protein n=1 Tax=Eumeta variegata TaxID=151549 RepID=A0A4C1V3Y1_EUMVA|nr:hypothetical protein EVAR_20153_1 [Eumeta japonica]